MDEGEEMRERERQRERERETEREREIRGYWGKEWEKKPHKNHKIEEKFGEWEKMDLESD